MPYSSDLICFAHLGWDFVYQRPQHLMSRCARERRVFYIEPPLFDILDGDRRLEITARGAELRVATPHLPASLDTVPRAAAAGERAVAAALRALIDRMLVEQDIRAFIGWYYTPMALNPTRHLRPLVTVYDCMDELAAFTDGSPALPALERELLARADLVFTGGYSLYEAKRALHPRVYPFPSGVDAAHFARARQGLSDPADQAAIPHPRLGFYGVLDERLDLDLLAGVADARPDWHQVFVGPVAPHKFDPALLPRRPNLHYLGMKGYDDLPAYLAGWDVATLPFARNRATRYISPTKTPEYLAAGKPVVSTSIHDVVHPYGDCGLVHIADTTAAFVAAVERVLGADRTRRLREGDAFLAGMSWDRTWAEMDSLIADAVAVRGGAGGAGDAGRGDATTGEVSADDARDPVWPSGVAAGRYGRRPRPAPVGERRHEGRTPSVGVRRRALSGDARRPRIG